jgi:hypothetical protein
MLGKLILYPGTGPMIHTEVFSLFESQQQNPDSLPRANGGSKVSPATIFNPKFPFQIIII